MKFDESWTPARFAREAMPGLALALALVLGTAVLPPARALAEDEPPPVLSNWNGARDALREKHGVTIALNYIAETLAIARGGIDRRASYHGRIELSADTDLEKLTGLPQLKGASTHFKIFNIQNGGHNAATNAGTIADPSNIDGLATTRLFTAWFQQEFYGGAGSVRIGQLAADDEFFTSDTAGGLINGTFGWGGILAANITNGGPAYPLATPGARLALKAGDQLTWLAAVFSGDPAGRNCTIDPQRCNLHGTTFSFAGGALYMSELQYAAGLAGGTLPGVYKVGVWYATAPYADQRLGVDPATGAIVSLADPAFTPDPFNHRGNWGVYGVIDQTVWKGGHSAVSFFLRGGVVPSDRNLVSVYVDGGVGIKGPFQSRPDEKLTFGVAHAKISGNAAALDRDTLLFSGPPYPIRDGETVFEASYIAQIMPYWSVQPDIQYIVRPGGGVPDPNNPAQRIGDTLIVGARSTINF